MDGAKCCTERTFSAQRSPFLAPGAKSSCATRPSNTQLLMFLGERSEKDTEQERLRMQEIENAS
eukprot:1151275-Pelagomonas_calceolata.AAC.12